MKNIFLLSIIGLFLIGCSQDISGPTNYDNTTVTNIGVDINTPSTATLNEPYDITINITNKDDEIQTITSIDIDTNYVEGIIFEGSTPEYNQSWDLTEEFNFYSYDYYIDIAPNDTENIVFHFLPVATGDYQGNIDVCINTEEACVFNTVRTIVSE